MVSLTFASSPIDAPPPPCYGGSEAFGAKSLVVAFQKRPLRKRRSDEKSSEGDEVSESKPPMTRRRSSRKSVQFANESQDSNKSEGKVFLFTHVCV